MELASVKRGRMKIKIMLPDKNGKPVMVSVCAMKLEKYFALHRDIRWARNSKGEKTNRIVVMRSGWTVTHLPTGYAAINRLKFRDQAEKAAKSLAAIKNINWKSKEAGSFRKESSKLPAEVRVFISKMQRTTLG